MLDRNTNKEMIEAIDLLAKEKGISKEVLFSAVEEALKNAYKNNFAKQNSYGMPVSRMNGDMADASKYRRTVGDILPQSNA